MRNQGSDNHRPPTVSAFAASAAIVLAGLTLTACGGGGQSPGGGSSGTAGGDGGRAKLERAALRHAECMRKRGIDVPDPKPGEGEGGIILSGPSSGGDPGADQLAAKKCEKYLRNVPPPKLSDEQKTAMRDGALKHARCMRGQGIEFPDPTFDDNGGITARIGDGFSPTDPRVRQAQKKCQKLLPRPDGDAVR